MNKNASKIAGTALYLLGAICVGTPVHAADEAKARELMTLMRADEFAAGAMKSITHQSQAEDGLTEAQVACVDAIKGSQLTDVVVQGLAQSLDAAEADAAIAFFRTPSGAKLMSLLNSKAFGTEMKESLTQADKDAIKAFVATPAGDKIMNQGVMVTSPVITKRMEALSKETVANCGKPAAR